MKHKIVMVMLSVALIASLVLAGCVKPATPPVEPVEPLGYFAITEDGVFLGGELIADRETYDAAIAEGLVRFYTAHSLRHEEEMARAFMARFPGIRVEITRAGGATLHEKMMAEEAAGVLKADVVLNSDANYIRAYYELGWLREYIPHSCDMYPEDSKMLGYWYPTGASAILIAYNTALVSEEEAPKDWIDLGDPKWAGRLGGQRLGGGAMWSMEAFIVSQLGWEVLEAWGRNEPIMQTSGSGMATALVAGEFAVCNMGLYASYSVKYQQGAPIEIVYPESGFPLYIPMIALLKFGENPNAAELFYNWYLSADGQSRLANIRGQFSLRDDVLPALYLPPLEELNYWIPDPEIYLDAALRDEWVAKANRIFGWEA